MKEIELGQEKETTIICGSHNKIIIEKLYGPTDADDIVIVWGEGDWKITRVK
jgi:hypothetical protein|tara:strand:+ start:34887 stop:35042 length:156 start_codon:yes stop_codon:yes gene_type:complete